MKNSHKNLVIGISFDIPEEYPEVSGPDDRFAEFEPESTILAMEAAIRWIGATPKRIGGPRKLLATRPEVDLVWNISEGYGTRNREGWVPVLCELYDIPCLGSDALTMSVSLDKSGTKQTARRLGIPTPHWVVARFSDWLDQGMSSEQSLKTQSELTALSVTTNFDDFFSQMLHQMKTSQVIFPVFIKPRYEGTGKGIKASSLVRDEQELVSEVHRQFDLYRQDLVVESFLSGAEFTLAVTGTPLNAHAVLERGIDSVTGIGYHLVDSGQNFRLFQNLSAELESRLQRYALDLSHEMGILDFARFDFKLDHDGTPFFLEVNPLPTFAVDNHFAILAELNDTSYDEFLGNILLEAVNRIQVGR